MPGYNLTRQEAEARAAIIAVQGYDIALDLTSRGETYTSTTTIHFTCAQVGAETFLDLIAPTVEKITLNGTDIDPASAFSDCRIHLPGLAAHNVVTVVAQAEYSHTGEGLHRFTDPVDGRTYLYSQFEVADARRMYASFEQPDLKSRFVFHVLTPADWTVIGNMPTPDPIEVAGAENVVRWDFPETPIMSTYLTAIIAGPYTKWEDTYASTDGRTIPLGVFVRESMAQHMDADDIFDVTKRGFEFYEKSFGIPYPYEKYDQAFVPEYNAGAMENIGAVTLTEARYIYRSKPLQADLDQRANTILHEQAHMWFGDLVTMKWWNDLWLNESFAEFMSHYAASHSRWPEAWVDLLILRKATGYAQDQLPTTHPIVADIRDLADVEVNFDMITYAKGASVLKQLVAWVGEESFLEGIHNYLTKHSWGNATLDDFLTEVGAASGRDLHEWAKVWLEEAGVTTLRPELDVRAEGIFEAVAIAQEVPPVYERFEDVPHRDLPAIEVHPSMRPHRVGIAGYSMSDDGLTKQWSYEEDIDGALTGLPDLAGTPVPDVVLLNDEDLTYAKIRFDQFSLENLTEHLGDMVDPLARSLVWASLRDSLRDGEVAPQAYVDIILGNIEKETSSTAVLANLRYLTQTVRRYVNPDVADSVRDDVAAQLIKMAMEDEAGSDLQLQLFKAFVGLSCNDTQWDFLGEILDGTSTVDGLDVDTDLRWELLTTLVAAGKRTEADIDAELATDDTSSGREAAAGARAALPGSKAKWEAWKLAVEDVMVPNATQRSIIAGFCKVEDPQVGKEFAIQYFSSLETVWVSRTREMAQNIINGLYPFWALNSEEIDILEMTDQWLGRLGAKEPSLRRLILALREEVICARIGQKVDAQ